MSTVKVGQVWEDKDKRRNTRIEIISVPTQNQGDPEAIGLVVGTEEERSYSIDRLIKRWRLIKEAPEPEVVAEPEPKASKFKTREQWLIAAVDEITKRIFKPKDIEVPAVRVSVGWPGGRGKKQGVVGQCFASTTATDKVAQIFVSPAVSQTLSVLATLTHELVHAVDDCKDGHKKNFIKIAREIGFEPEWTSSENRGDELNDKLKAIAEKLGEFPHAAIRPDERPTVQKTYMLKVVSPEEPDFFVRMTQGKIDEYGLPRDPWGNEMEVEEK